MDEIFIARSKSRKRYHLQLPKPDTSINTIIIDKDTSLKPNSNDFLICNSNLKDIVLTLEKPEKNISFNIMNIGSYAVDIYNHEQEEFDRLERDESLSVIYVSDMDRFYIY